MRIIAINAAQVRELNSPVQPDALVQLQLPDSGYLWLACERSEFEQRQADIQAMLMRLCQLQLVDLHVADLLNPQLPSRYDYTAAYDLLVFRRLTTDDVDIRSVTGTSAHKRSGPPILRRITTKPVGFVVFDRILLTVHPDNCTVDDTFAQRLLASTNPPEQPNVANALSAPDTRSAGARGVAANPPDLMLRIINHMVDSFLSLRRELSHQLDHWQAELLSPKTRFARWSALLEARQTLHQLAELCEDQGVAIQDWTDEHNDWSETDPPLTQAERDMLQVRSRDVLEHIERVARHVRQLEQSAETAVQIHFNAQSHRTNEIMRTLTVLTAIFLPLNFITGFFGMNFEFLPLIHTQTGLWWALGAMGTVALLLVLVFWRKRYLTRTAR